MTASYKDFIDQPADARGGIKQALDSLDASVDVLTELAGTLADKLEFVMRPAVPRGVPGDDEAAKRAVSDTSPVQEHLCRTSGQVRGVIAELRDLIERLET